MKRPGARSDFDQDSFVHRLRRSLPVGTVLQNPGRGTTTVISLDGDRLRYRRGRSDFYVDLCQLYAAALEFAGSRVTTKHLKAHAPSVFDLKQGGHGCHATVLLMVLAKIGISGPITGRGVTGDPFGVDVRRPATWGLTRQQLRHFRDEFRAARAAALADAEGYKEPLHALERFGRFLEPSARSLWDATDVLSDIATRSCLANDLPQHWPEFHSHFRGLLASTRHARNDVMHVGSRARHLTTHAAEVCAILEDALQEDLNTIADYMVRNIVFVESWYPVSELRRRMLENSFTFVPVRPGDGHGEWRLVGDHHLAQYLGDRQGRQKRLSSSVRDATDNGLGWEAAHLVDAKATLDEVRQDLEQRPILVTTNDHVVGILAAFDLL